jgi:flagellar hook-associated protein 2
MSTISSAGIGSGLDVESIVTKLMAIEKQPLTALQTQASALDSKISAFGTITSQLSALNDSVTALSLPATWSSKTVSSSNTTAVSASVSGTGALTTSFSLQVSQLAQGQSVASSAVTAGSGFGAGSLSIQLGTWAGTTPAFTAGSAAAVSVTVAQGDSMSTIAGKINAAGAGVTATVIKDLSGERLLMRSTATGEASGFRIQTTDGAGATGPSLAALAFDNPSAGAGMAANPVQYGLNAKASINGVAIASASNTLADTVPGLTLTLSQVTTAPVEIAVSNDTGSQTTAVNAFVKAYNAMNEMFNAATKYDSTTKTGALLQGDSTTTGLQTAMRTLIGAVSGGGGTLQRLSDLGISISKDGAGDLAIDSTKLAAALKDPVGVGAFFTSATGKSDSATGFATRMKTFLDGAIGSAGILAVKTTSLQSQKTSNGKDQARLSDRLTTVEANMRKQYSALDTKMASLTALNSYITQQIAQWNKTSG